MGKSTVRNFNQTDDHPLVVHGQLNSATQVEGRVFLLEDSTPLKLLDSLISYRALHAISDTGLDILNGLTSSIVMIEAPKVFFENSLGVILDPLAISDGQRSKMESIVLPFHNSKQKEEILDSVEKFSLKCGASKTMIGRIHLVADELFTNALFNAPFGRTGLLVDRAREITLEKDFGACLYFGFFDGKFALVCEDPYGSLVIESVLERLYRCYENGARDMINWGRGGAGLGSFLVLENCDSIFYGVSDQVRTVVGTVFNIGKGHQRNVQPAKSIHTLNLEFGKLTR